MVEQQRLDRAYNAFVAELHRRIAATSPSTRFETGIAPAAYCLGVAIMAGVSVGLATLILRALQAQSWAGAGIVVAFLGAFLWHAGNYFRRNRPSRYQPNALPPELLPRAST